MNQRRALSLRSQRMADSFSSPLGGRSAEAISSAMWSVRYCSTFPTHCSERERASRPSTTRVTSMSEVSRNFSISARAIGMAVFFGNP